MLTVADSVTSYTRLTGVFLAVNQHVFWLPILMPENAALPLSDSKVIGGNSNRSKSDGRCLTASGSKWYSHTARRNNDAEALSVVRRDIE